MKHILVALAIAATLIGGPREGSRHESVGSVRAWPATLPGQPATLGAVEWESGDTFEAGWEGHVLVINGVGYEIAAVLSPTELLVFGQPASGCYEVRQ